MDPKARMAVVIVAAAAAFHLLPMAFGKSAQTQKDEIEKMNRNIAEKINKK